MDAPDLGYDDGNRAFLQSFMARGTMTLKQAKPMLAAIFTIQGDEPTDADSVTQEDLDSYISAAADIVSPYDYEIRSTWDQVTKERIYAFVNSVSDPITQIATTRTPEEVFYIKRFLDAMFISYNTRRREAMAITGMQALETKVRKPSRESVGEEATQGQASDKGLTSEQAESLLKSLVDEGWITRSREGFYTLSPRGLMELRNWLIDTYNDPDDSPAGWRRIKTCDMCSDIVTIGQRCPNLDCHVRIHNVCEEGYWATRGRSKKCPSCGTAWDGEHYVGQKAVTSTEEYLKGKRRSGISKKRAAVELELSSEDEEVEPESSRAGPSRRKDIQQLIKIRLDFASLTLVIFGSGELPHVARELVKARVPVIFTANRGAPDIFEERFSYHGPLLSRSPAAVITVPSNC
ncbi:RING-like domain-containing protein [Drepanopeziza brunnea f. sp. 'multigermtubi' MB_m1]|uniref:Non-structural maintenance of chromosomes element 1 homolog n=1 Tax=Marssonina brunnea f. sp. multigermtubi (strain MB_m1) TaxID=1072389 RepID=K1XLK9_MARBU|nr:RING-like domain-containing protein [Drepanopeziza brunnea f. sp. 'multigermtubi' MB_m1]EKD21453.1 RING-like domain-containing protein [Drepanopeziza brunnea f. sp. 'multigermtubi' MB_m1]